MPCPAHRHQPQLACEPGTLHGRPGNDTSLPCSPVWKPSEFSRSDILGVLSLGNWPLPTHDSKEQRLPPGVQAAQDWLVEWKRPSPPETGCLAGLGLPG